MSNGPQKLTKRGFVMTGGGAKGLYEAGVIHALHLCGMEFDVITGSSIGAINAILYAEYLLGKRNLAPEIRDDPKRCLEEMDGMIKAFHHAWLRMPDIQIIDDSETGPLGRLKDDLLQFDVDLPLVTRLVWWWTDPKPRHLRSPEIWPSIVKLVHEAIERLGSGREFLSILGKFSGQGKSAVGEATLRAYLARFGLEQAVVPPEDDHKLKDLFTEPMSPLRPEHLQGKSVRDSGDSSHSGDKERLIPPERTFRDFADAGIDVRLTRANYRTGRLEISAYLSARDFVAYLEKYAFRWMKRPQHAVALGSSRLHVLGNPNAINAALASGRFPGVFAPFPVKTIYGLEDGSDLGREPENELLNRMLENWLDDDEVEHALYEAFRALHADENETRVRRDWEELYSGWRDSAPLRDLFPRANDSYVDGGAIDNSPSRSGIDAVREWIGDNDGSLRDYNLDLYVVFLDQAPDPGLYEPQGDPALYQVVQRTLEIQGAAKLASDAVVVRAINTFGSRAERLGRTASSLSRAVRSVIANLEQDLPDDLTLDQKRAVESAIRARLKSAFREEAQGLGYSKGSVNEILDRINRSSTRTLRERLPLNVEPIEIYPDEMPMSTLQFTERLGYESENAIQMLTVGCYNTLWALRAHLEEKAEKAAKAEVELDDIDRRALGLAREWMGTEEWPGELGELRSNWQCQRQECTFYAAHCRHGKCRGL